MDEAPLTISLQESLNDSLIVLAYALPDFLLAAVIVVVGLWGACLLRKFVTTTFDSTGLPAARLSGHLVFGICATVVAIMAATRMGFDTSFLASFLLIVTAGCAAMLALSVGLGAGPAIKNLIGTYSVRHFVKIGQQVQVGEMSGKVVDLTSMVLVLEVEGKQVVIPASRLNDGHMTINPQTGT
jgi:small-conductance mechanosensitive channel